jgi:hypothetical protein
MCLGGLGNFDQKTDFSCLGYPEGWRNSNVHTKDHLPYKDFIAKPQKKKKLGENFVIYR